MKPQPRPALKRADDAELHPALSVEPTQLPTRLAKDLAAQQRAAGQPATDRAGKSAGKPDGKSAGKPAGKADKRKPASGRFAKSEKGSKPFQSAGQATSDSLRGKSDKRAKQVRLDVQVPKKLRKELRAIAKHSGSSVDSIVTHALNDWLGDPRRW